MLQGLGFFGPHRPPALLANAFSAPDALHLAQAQAGPPSPAMFGSPTTAGLRTPPYAAARHARYPPSAPCLPCNWNRDQRAQTAMRLPCQVPTTCTLPAFRLHYIPGCKVPVGIIGSPSTSSHLSSFHAAARNARRPPYLPLLLCLGCEVPAQP